MARLLVRDIINIIEERFPPRWQDGYDNTGLQIGEPLCTCTGVLLCVDVTPEIVVEAYDKGCNLIISHHPLIFHPLKRITGYNRVDRAICAAIRNDIAVYSCHTSADNAKGCGVSWEMGRMLGLQGMSVLGSRDEAETGAGVCGSLPHPVSPSDFISIVKGAFGSPVVRCSSLSLAAQEISRVALCGGAGGFLIPEAIGAGAQAFVTSDCKHNQFIDYLGMVFLVDIGHYESEECTKRIFYQIIKEKIPNFALCYSELEKNPINYL